MAIAFVQSAKAQGTTKTITPTFGAGATAGNLLVATLSGTAAGVGSAVKQWTSAGWAEAARDPFSSDVYGVEIMYKVAAGGETAVGFAIDGSTGFFHSAVMAEYSGLAATSPLDVFANDGTNSSVGTTSRATGTTGTTAQADELAIAAVGQGNTVTALSWTNSFATRDSNAQAGSGVYLADKILSATGTVTSTASWTTSRIAGGCVATFKGSVAAGDAFVPRTIVF